MTGLNDFLCHQSFFLRGKAEKEKRERERAWGQKTASKRGMKVEDEKGWEVNRVAASEKGFLAG